MHDKSTFPMQRSLMLPSRFRSTARTFSTPARTSAVLLTRYTFSVLSSSSLGHWQVGHSFMVLSAVAAITSPSMLMMCQNAMPECHSRTDQLVCPEVIFCSFAQLVVLVDLSDDRIHGQVIQAETTLCLLVLVRVGAS